MARLILIPSDEMLENAEALRKVLQHFTGTALVPEKARYEVLNDVRQALGKLQSHLKGAGYDISKRPTSRR